MKKIIYKLFGFVLLEITHYEDEKEMPVKTKGEGKVLELTDEELKKLQK